ARRGRRLRTRQPRRGARLGRALEPAPRELAEALARGLVRPERAFVGVDVAGDLLGDRTDFGDDPRLEVGIAEQLVDPGVGAVVRLHVVLEQEFAEEKPDPDVR